MGAVMLSLDPEVPTPSEVWTSEPFDLAAMTYDDSCLTTEVSPLARMELEALLSGCMLQDDINCYILVDA